MSFGNTVNNREKNGALLAYIAERNPNIHLRKLLKMVYLIDEKFMEKRGFPLTWFDYHAWEKGSVAPEVYAVKEGAFSSFVHCQKNQDGQNIVTPALKYDCLINKQMEAYSLYEKEIVDSVIDTYGAKSADELSEITIKEARSGRGLSRSRRLCSLTASRTLRFRWFVLTKTTKKNCPLTKTPSTICNSVLPHCHAKSQEYYLWFLQVHQSPEKQVPDFAIQK